MPFDPSQYGLGWNSDDEKQHDSPLASLTVSAAPVTAPMPDEVDPPLPVNNQGRRNACCGNALDKCLEFDHFVETGTIVNLSARYSYLIAKTIDGTVNGPDAGATIGGAAIAAQKCGACLEEIFPYWTDDEPYTTAIPQEAIDQGQQHRLGAICDIRSIDQGLDLIGSGQGAFIFGIPWYESLANYDGSQEVVQRVRGGVLGGHALCVAGYKTIGGQRIPKVWNSHSEQWGNRGTMLIDPDLLWKLINSGGFGARGVTQLPAFTERKIDRFNAIG